MLITPWRHSMPGRNRKGPMMSDLRGVKGPHCSAPWRERPLPSTFSQIPFRLNKLPSSQIWNSSLEAWSADSGYSSHQAPFSVRTWREALRRPVWS